MTTQERLEQRLRSLKTEFELGQKKLAGLDDEAQQLRHLLLRIAGGIQVLEEELARQADPPSVEPGDTPT